MNNGAAKTSAPCDHTTTGCDHCEPAVKPTGGVFGDADGDFDAADAAELAAEVGAARFDDDPSPSAGTDDDGGFCGGDDW